MRTWSPVVALLVVLFLQVVLGARQLSATFDETAHLPAGYTYLETGDLRLNPQHPPLIKLLAAVPLLAAAPEVDLDDPGWNAVPPDEWAFGYRFLYRQDADRLLMLGRLPIALLAVLMAWYVFRWASDLFGVRAGWMALLLCAFSPTVIAHARFVTMDVGLACFSTIGLYHLWRFVEEGRTGDLVFSGIGLGLALASKFSGVALLPVYAGSLLLARPLAGEAQTIRGRQGRTALGAVGSLAAALGLAGLVVWASYLFTADPLVYWRGLVRVNQDHDPNYLYYLLGEFRAGGFWYYFPVAFLVKTPIPTLLVLFASIAMVGRYRAPHPAAEWVLVAPVVVYVALTMVFADNLGVRYLLPIYPLLFVFASRLARGIEGSRLIQVTALALALWYAGGTLAIQPDQLAYFNELAGGPAGGNRWLDDSNIDWSQDLKRLAEYLDEHDAGPVRLRYGRNVAPDYYGIDARPMSDAEWGRANRPPGLYAIGTQQLIRGRLYREQHGLDTDWLENYQPVARIGYSLYLFEF